jgi:hypothetical protein
MYLSTISSLYFSFKQLITNPFRWRDKERVRREGGGSGGGGGRRIVRGELMMKTYSLGFLFDNGTRQECLVPSHIRQICDNMVCSLLGLEQLIFPQFSMQKSQGIDIISAKLSGLTDLSISLHAPAQTSISSIVFGRVWSCCCGSGRGLLLRFGHHTF